MTTAKYSEKTRCISCSNLFEFHKFSRRISVMKRIAENTNYGEEFNNNLLSRETLIRENCGKIRNRLRAVITTR